MKTEELILEVLKATPEKRRAIENIIKGIVETKKPLDENRKQETRLVGISQAARMLALGRNTVYLLIKTNRLDTVDLNGCRRITMRSINAFLDGERPANEKTLELIKQSKRKYADEKK